MENHLNMLPKIIKENYQNLVVKKYFFLINWTKTNTTERRKSHQLRLLLNQH